MHPDRSVVLNWTDEGNATNFTVQRATNVSFTNNLPAFPLGKVTTCTNPIGSPNQTFYYRVFASNVVGDTAVYPAPSVGFPKETLTSGSSNIAPYPSTAPLAPPAAPLRQQEMEVDLDTLVRGLRDGMSGEKLLMTERPAVQDPRGGRRRKAHGGGHGKGVIPGWTEALKLMPAGSRWRLFIPPGLAYRERGAGRDIGPNATLIFEVELLAVR